MPPTPDPCLSSDKCLRLFPSATRLLLCSLFFFCPGEFFCIGHRCLFVLFAVCSAGLACLFRFLLHSLFPSFFLSLLHHVADTRVQIRVALNSRTFSVHLSFNPFSERQFFLSNMFVRGNSRCNNTNNINLSATDCHGQ